MTDLMTTTAIDIGRVATGAFFLFSGYHKLTNKTRHAALVDTLKSQSLPFVGFLQWWVPGWELSGGAMVITGWPPAVILGSLALMAICLIACLTDGRKRIAAEAPIDKADYADDVLYLPEFLYLILLSIFAAEAASAMIG